MKPRRPQRPRRPQYGSYYNYRYCCPCPYYYWDDYEYDYEDYDYEYDWGGYEDDSYVPYDYTIEQAYRKGVKQGMARARELARAAANRQEAVAKSDDKGAE